MEDDHVDRPGVEAQQCVKLTGTNSSIGLIVLITHGHFSVSRQSASLTAATARCTSSGELFARFGEWRQAPGIGAIRKTSSHAFRRPGGYCEVAAPDPIPNSAVKRLCADGTLSQGTGE